MKAYLSRRYHFSASHRLHAAGLTEEANQAAFGKCNNPFGHGHNYTVQVTFSGSIDPATGMVTNLATLDAFAGEQLMARFDHTNLNTLEVFRELVPTTENLAIELHTIFKAYPHAHLETLHVEETENNSFDFSGSAPPPVGRL